MYWLIVVNMLGCGANQKEPVGCPAGSVRDQQRVSRFRLYQSIPSNTVICWGKWPFSVIDQHGRILLRHTLTPKLAAARVAHLLQHQGKSAPAKDDCVAWWIQEEAQAMALELDLLRQWGESAQRFAYADAYYAAEPGKGIQTIADFIYAHPHGAPGMDGLLTGYQRRCGK